MSEPLFEPLHCIVAFSIGKTKIWFIKNNKEVFNTEYEDNERLVYTTDINEWIRTGKVSRLKILEMKGSKQ